jgi:hypothetical protein
MRQAWTLHCPAPTQQQHKHAPSYQTCMSGEPCMYASAATCPIHTAELHLMHTDAKRQGNRALTSLPGTNMIMLQGTPPTSAAAESGAMPRSCCCFCTCCRCCCCIHWSNQADGAAAAASLSTRPSCPAVNLRIPCSHRHTACYCLLALPFVRLLPSQCCGSLHRPDHRLLHLPLLSLPD